MPLRDVLQKLTTLTVSVNDCFLVLISEAIVVKSLFTMNCLRFVAYGRELGLQDFKMVSQKKCNYQSCEK